MARPKASNRPHSVRDRTTGECPDCGTEQDLDEHTGLITTHNTVINDMKVRCQGIGESPARIIHNPDLAVAVRATIKQSTVRRGSTLKKKARKSAVRKPPSAGKVTVTAVDPKVWADALAACKRLGIPASSIQVMFRLGRQ